MSISLPPRPPELDDRSPDDQEALIEEARRRRRRRRRRNFVGFLATLLGALWLYSLVGGGGPDSGSAFLSEPSSASAAPPKEALPEELSYNANGGVVLVRRDGTRHVLARAEYRQRADGTWFAGSVRLYNGIQWSRDGSKLLALRWGSPRVLVVIDRSGAVGPTIAHALDGRWSPDGAGLALVRREPGRRGRVLYSAASDGRNPVLVATRLGAFSWSPDGTKLAYTRLGASGISIATSSGQTVLSQVGSEAWVGAAPAIGGEVQWSPDGSLIAFGTGSGAFVVRPDGTSLRRVMAGGYGIVWSPDSRRLGLVARGRDVYTVRADGGGLRRIAHCPCTYRGATGTSLAWSPDGSRIAYVSGRGNDLSTIRPDGTRAVVVAPRAVPGPSGLAVGWPLWRPDHE